jgi:penicillin amidase
MNLQDRLWGATIAATLFARAALTPKPPRVTTAQRLAMLPLQGAPVAAPVSIRWNAHQVPFINAGSDADLATALGVVHAHLRLGQIDLMRRISQGEISAMIGPLGVELDRTILLMDLPRAVPAIIAALPPATRAWAEHFVAGLNHVIATGACPYEHKMLGLRIEPFTLQQFFTLSRLVSADISWVIAARLLGAREKSGTDWPAIWPKLLRGGAPSSFMSGSNSAADWLARHMRAGSNAASISGAHTSSGAALIASDPHLGLSLPATWLIAGMRSPTTHAVGLMIPGMPFVALGRNDHIAWGGTSLHAASSDLIDVSSLPPAAFTERHHRLAIRGAAPRVLVLRESPHGPVVTDGLLIKSAKPLALRWVGHTPSDELSAMLGVSRARNFEEFSAALDGFAVPGQTMICAAADGRVGKRAAVHMPRRRVPPPPDIVLQPCQAWGATDIAGGEDMPVWADPAEGIIVSANENPGAHGVPPGPPLGFFFAPPDRAQRLHALLAAPGPRAEADMQALQQDVLHPGALPVRDALLARLPAADPDFRMALQAWNGAYDAHSSGALAYELLIGHCLIALFPETTAAPFNAVWGTRLLLLAEMENLPAAAVQAALHQAAAAAARGWRRWKHWGALHRYRPSHYFANIPLLGRRFRGEAFPAPGGDDTLHKSAHGLRIKPHYVTFGACARFVSDLADPDANRFVLLGGQDGWLGSENFDDQIALWRTGRYITLPMREQTLLTLYPHETVLLPTRESKPNR